MMMSCVDASIDKLVEDLDPIPASGTRNHRLGLVSAIACKASIPLFEKHGYSTYHWPSSAPMHIQNLNSDPANGKVAVGKEVQHYDWM